MASIAAPPTAQRRRARIAAGHAHAWLLRRTKRRPHHGPARVALLTTTGRRSGRARTTPVEIWSLDARELLVAAAGGAATPPAWWHNLRADPHVSVDGHPAVARPLGTLEQRLAWARLVSADPRLEGVRARAGHDLPVVELRYGSGGPTISVP